MAVRVINDESNFQAELAQAGVRLVVVDFTATWCGPCQRIAPVFETFPSKYPKAIFLKVDVDKCQDTAAGQGVSAMPTFIFYRNRTKIDRIQGADIMGLEAKIREHIGSSDGEESGEDYGQGLVIIEQRLLCRKSKSLPYPHTDGAEHIHLEAGVRVPE